MSTDWMDNAQLDALLDQAQNSRSRSVAFDPDAPGGFRLLTEQEDRDLIGAIALPHQRHVEDRDALAARIDRAERTGDLDRADELGEHLKALDEERARDQRTDPRLPSRDQIDKLWERGVEVGWSEPTSRAVDYLDGRRDYADERRAAHERGELGEVDRPDRKQAQRDRGLCEYLEDPELDDEGRER